MFHYNSQLYLNCDSFVFCWSNCKLGRAIAQAVSRWLPTAAARVRTPVSSCGIL
jgi:hypothetical protein